MTDLGHDETAIPFLAQTARGLSVVELARAPSLLYPGLLIGIRRTSMRPGSQIESGRRRLVFSFFFCKSALALDSGDDLAGTAPRAAGEQRVDICVPAIELEPCRST